MGTSFIKFGLKKQATFGGKSFPILGKFPWDLYWENKTFKLKRTIPCERKTIRWASKLSTKIKAMAKKGTTSRIFVQVFCCCCCCCLFFFFAVYFMIIYGLSWIFIQTRSQLKRLKNGESSREGCWEGRQSEFVWGRTRTESAVFVIEHAFDCS